MKQNSTQNTHLDQINPTDALSKANTQLNLLSPTSLDDSAFSPALDFQFAEASKESESILDLETLPQTTIDGYTASLEETVGANTLKDASHTLPATPDSDLQSGVEHDSQSPRSIQGHDKTSTNVPTRRPNKQRLTEMNISTKQNAVAADSVELDRTHKKQRKNNDGVESSKERQKERSRAKNKVAAAKCRLKKRENMETIESAHRSLSAENSLLRREEQELRAAVAQLRTLALDHQNCDCGIHQYNMFEAKKLAQGLGGVRSSGMSSADLRAASMSGIPGVSGSDFHPQPRSHSFVANHSHLGEVREEDQFFGMEDPVFESSDFYNLDPGMVVE